jgi:hypothetical protein
MVDPIRVFMLPVVLMAIGGYYQFYDIPRKLGSDQQFIERGVPVKGELVQKIEETSSGRRNRTSTYYLRIGYQHPKEGKKVCKLEVNVDTYKKIFQDTPLTILYLPENAEAIMIKGESSVSPWQITFSKWAFWLGLLATIGLGVLYGRQQLMR